MKPDRQTRTIAPPARGPGRAPALRFAVAVALAAAGCGDTLVDHNGGSFVTSCQGTVTSCGQGSACVDCTDPVQNPRPLSTSQPICSVAATCGYQCNDGWLHCDAGCCRALSVATGWYHTCAILVPQLPATSGQLRCWGANEYGQLGRDDRLYLDSPVPVDVAGMASGVTQVAAGSYQTCAIQNGTAYCWGWNDAGQVGAGTDLFRYDYRQAVVNTGSGALTSVAPGGRHTCALNASGEVWCWGANERGQLGQGNVDSNVHKVPLKVPSLSGMTALASGRYHTCAIASGPVSCWGADDFGQIGDGVTPVTGRNVPTPTAAGAFTNATAIALGNEFSLAITPGAPDPQLWGWGANAWEQLGSAHPPDAVATPTLATISVKPTAIAAGRAHTCALKFDGVNGSLKCFGANDQVQLGDPTSSPVDVTFGVSTPPVQVAAGFDHTCARLEDGSLYCWGANDRGQAGNGVATPSTPVQQPTFVTGR